MTDETTHSVEGAREVLVIRASEWWRGHHESGLYWGGRFCCLGLDARRHHASLDKMKDSGTPRDLRCEYVRFPAKINQYFARWVDSNEGDQAVTKAVAINDDESTTDEQKIAALRPIFASVGIDIVWEPNQ